MVMRYFRGKKYFYIAGTTPEGKPFFFGNNWESEAEARMYAYEKLANLLNMEIVTSDYKDIRRAQAGYRPKIFDNTGNMDAALQRIAHDEKKVM